MPRTTTRTTTLVSTTLLLLAAALAMLGCDYNWKEPRWLYWPWPDDGYWDRPAVQQCRTVGEWEWLDIYDVPVMASGGDGEEFMATFGDFATWTGEYGEFCAVPVGIRVPNQDACVWICEQEALHRGATDPDCAHQVRTWWRVMNNDLDPYFAADALNINPNADDSTSYARVCQREDYPFVPEVYPVPPAGAGGAESTWCAPDLTDALNIDDDWDADPSTPSFAAPGARVMVEHDAAYPPRVYLAPGACGFPVDSFGDQTPDEACRGMCQQLVDAYVTEHDLAAHPEALAALADNCDTFHESLLCPSAAPPSGYPFTWDVAAGVEQRAPLECGVGCCGLAGAQACRNVRRGTVERRAAVRTASLAATVRLSAPAITAAAQVQIGYTPTTCASVGGACPLYVERLALTAPGPIVLPASSLWPQATVTDLRVEAVGPGLGAHRRGQLRLAPGALTFDVSAQVEDRQGVGQSVRLLAISPGITEGTLTGDQISGLRWTLTLAPGVVVQLDAGPAPTLNP